MRFADDTTLEVDVLVFSAGIRPRDQLARDCGLDVGERGGVARRRRLPHVGSAHLRHRRMRARRRPHLGPGRSGLRHGPRRGRPHPRRRQPPSPAADMSTKLKLMGVDVASFGDAFATTEGARVDHLRRSDQQGLQAPRRRRRRHPGAWRRVRRRCHLVPTAVADGAGRHADTAESGAAHLSGRRRRARRDRCRRARRHRDGVFVQQRDQGRHLRRHHRSGLTRTRRSEGSARRPARPAAAACRS